MKYLGNILTTLLLGWPALVVGYAYAALKSGFLTGQAMQDRHEVAAIKRFVKTPPKITVCNLMRKFAGQNGALVAPLLFSEEKTPALHKIQRVFGLFVGIATGPQ